jgi:hypothetical protein
MCSRKDVGMYRQAKQHFYSGKEAFYCGRVKEGTRSFRLARRRSRCGVAENSIERSPLQSNVKYRKSQRGAREKGLRFTGYALPNVNGIYSKGAAFTEVPQVKLYIFLSSNSTHIVCRP